MLRHIGRLRTRKDSESCGPAADEDRYNAVLMDMQQAIQGRIDLAPHVCADDGLGAPAGAGEAIALLSRAGLIDDRLHERLRAAAGLRNLIVHQYTELDAGRLLEAIRERLGDLERLLARLRARPARS